MWKANKDLSFVSQIDWARLAAFIDGEGHIRTVRKKTRIGGKRGADYVQVTISNTDPRLITWLQMNFGGGKCYHFHDPLDKYSGHWKTNFHWDVASAQATLVLQGCLPYFIIKREQAELALAFAATMKRRGVKGTPQEILDQREDIKDRLRLLTKRGAPTTAVAVNE